MRYIAAEDVAKAKEMEKYITDERTGLKYELVGDYYLVVGDDEPEEDQPIRIWGQRHLRHLKRRHKVIYSFERRIHFLFGAGKAEIGLTVSVFYFQFNHGKSP